MEKLTNKILKNSSWEVNPKQSRRLQEIAFVFGFGWDDHTSEVKHTEVRNLFFEDDLFFASDEEYPRFKKMKFEDWFKEEEDKEYPNPIPEYPKPVELPKGKLTYIEGSFAWAVEKMEKGEKLRRRNWTVPTYVSLDMSEGEGNYKFTCDMLNTINFVFSYYSLTARDWEVYEEKVESLSDMEIYAPNVKTLGRTHEEGLVFPKSDIKKAVKELLEFTQGDGIHDGSVNHKIKELFGKKLI